MFCMRCGIELEEGMVFCPQCGTRQIDIVKQGDNLDHYIQERTQRSSRAEVKTRSVGVREVTPSPQTRRKRKRKKANDRKTQKGKAQWIMLLLIAVIAVVCGVFFYIKAKVNDVSAPGSKVKWKVEGGTLHVSGEGETQKFPEPVLLGFGLIGQPWRDQRLKWVPIPVTREKQFDKVVVSEGITVIGENFFMGDSFSSVVLPDSLIEIGDCSFGGISGLEEIYIPRAVERVYDNAFLNDNEINYRGSISEWLNILYSDSYNRLTAGASYLYCSDAQLDENKWRDPIRSTNITYMGTLESWFNIIEGYNTESIGLVTCSDGEWDYSKSEGNFDETAEQIRQEVWTEVPVDALPPDLEEFFIDFLWGYHFGADSPEISETYDCLTAAEAKWNILARIVQNPTCVDFERYPGNGVQEYWDAQDIPTKLKEWGHPTNQYAAFDRESVDWIAKNVFNLSDDAIQKLVARAEAEHLFYLEGDNYIRAIGGLGLPGSRVEIRSAMYDGERYYIEYDWFAIYVDDVEKKGTFLNSFYAVCGYETTDGVEYWSLYQHGEKKM